LGYFDIYTPLMISAGKSRMLSGFCVLVGLLANQESSSQNSPLRSVHVFVALADNEHQGIVPIPARLGNGLDPAHNLYWGAAAGVKTFFIRSADWAGELWRTAETRSHGALHLQASAGECLSGGRRLSRR
jgi:hypothetical protein